MTTEKIKVWGSFCTSAAGLLYALLKVWQCKVEHAEMQASIQALADALFR